MGFAATMIFYHLIGLGVATAVFLAEPEKNRLPPLFRTATAVIFWPLYVPILLADRSSGRSRKSRLRMVMTMPCH